MNGDLGSYLIGIEEKVIDLFVERCLMKDFVQFLMDNSNMKPQAVNVRELGLANVALQLLLSINGLNSSLK